MAYEYDRFEREDGSGSFLMGLLAGTVLGAGLGMLFAPKSGTELRSQLSESAGRLRSTANETYHQATDKVSRMVDRGREAYDRARSSMGADTTGTAANMSDTGYGNTGYGNTGALGSGGNLGTAGSTESMSGAGSGGFNRG